MADSYHDIENQIKDALCALDEGDISHISAAACHFNVSRQRLYHCFHDCSAKSDLQNHNQCLIDPEETALHQYLDCID